MLANLFFEISLHVEVWCILMYLHICHAFLSDTRCIKKLREKNEKLTVKKKRRTCYLFGKYIVISQLFLASKESIYEGVNFWINYCLQFGVD